MPGAPHAVLILSELLLMGRTWSPFANLPTPLALALPIITTRVLAHLAHIKKQKAPDIKFHSQLKLPGSIQRERFPCFV